MKVKVSQVANKNTDQMFMYSSMRKNRATTCTCVPARTHRTTVHTLNETFCAARACMHGFILIHIHGVWQQGAYLVSILHALKYPANSVNGVLVHIMKFAHTLYLQTGTHARTHARTHTHIHTHTHTHTHTRAYACTNNVWYDSLRAFEYSCTLKQTHTRALIISSLGMSAARLFR